MRVSLEKREQKRGRVPLFAPSKIFAAVILATIVFSGSVQAQVCGYGIYSTQQTNIRDRVQLSPGIVGSAAYVEVGVEALKVLIAAALPPDYVRVQSDAVIDQFFAYAHSSAARPAVQLCCP